MWFSDMVCVGAGGIGLHFIPAAARLLAYRAKDVESDTEVLPTVIVCDGDKYEERNIERQLMSPGQVGVNKAMFAASQIAGIVDVETWDRYLSGPDDLVSHLAEFKECQDDESQLDEALLIAICVDNDATRKLIYDALNEFYEKLTYVVIDMANGDRTGNVSVHMQIKAGDQWLRPFPHPFDLFAQLKDPKDRVPGGGCSANEADAGGQTIQANMQAATLGVEMLWRLLHDLGSVKAENGFDLEKGKMWAN